jgi:hypothetical protein
MFFLSDCKEGKTKVVPLYTMKAYGGQEVWLHSFLTLALDEVEWSISRLDCFMAKKELRYRLNRTRCARFGERKNEDKRLPRVLTSYESVTSYQVSEEIAAFVLSNKKKSRRAVNLRDPYKKQLLDQPNKGCYRKALTVQVQQSTTVGGKINHFDFVFALYVPYQCEIRK